MLRSMTAFVEALQAGNVNRTLTICNHRILTTPEQCFNFEILRVNHLTPSS